MKPVQSAYILNERPEIVTLVPRDATAVLDVGCASGGFGVAVRAALGPDLRLVGVEAIAGEAEQARTRGVYDEVVDGYFPEAIAGREESFDLVVFNDVLEHMVDPWSALVVARERLVPHGRVLASIPNVAHFSVIQRLVRGRWDYADYGILDRTHLRFFTRKTIMEMFDDSGYDVTEITGINPALDDRGRLTRLFPIAGDFKWVQFAVLARPNGEPPRHARPPATQE